MVRKLITSIAIGTLNRNYRDGHPQWLSKVRSQKNSVIKNPIFRLLFLIISSILFDSCTKGESTTMFRRVPNSNTDIHFNNQITENDEVNILNNYYVYNGGGVGIGDFNQDGLVDVYFSGNMVSSKMYLNQGQLRFKDITEEAGVGTTAWVTGVSIVDINQDKWPDLYLSTGIFCKSGCSNRLLINQGLDPNGVPTFTEDHDTFGSLDDFPTTHTAFLDYDLDGDLDLFAIKNEVTPINKNILFKKDSRLIKGRTTDKLLRNDGMLETGRIQFTDVSLEAGIIYDGYSLGVAIQDINNDNWPDIYVANDFFPEDLIYINQKDGTFKESGKQYLKHQSYNSMGVDIADFNNDDLADIVVLDMLPEDNMHQKRMLTPMNYDLFSRSLELGYAAQFMRNTLQLNNGTDAKNKPIAFSEIGQLSGIHQTDWSWSPLLADFDMDGYKDLFITNGFVKDMTDLDFINYRKPQILSEKMKGKTTKLEDLYNQLDGDYLPNYIFKNEDGYTFSNKVQEWGLNQPSFSNGAAYCDLDNDGDLDLVVNNINAEAFIYENTVSSNPNHNFLTISLNGPDENRTGIGSKVRVWYGGNLFQLQYLSPFTGYLSTLDTRLHFGLGTHRLIDSLEVTWPDGRTYKLKSLPSNDMLVIDYNKSTHDSPYEKDTQPAPVIFSRASDLLQIHHVHKENEFNDFKQQPLLLEMLSRQGPAMAVSGTKGDKDSDIFIGGAAGFSGSIFSTTTSGNFQKFDFPFDLYSEDVDAAFFDVDNDGDNDLYVVSGGSEYPEGSELYQDRLYINQGSNKWVRDSLALPSMKTSGSCVDAHDFDQDGDLDLFVGGRLVPGRYPISPKSYLLINENGKFIDRTMELMPELQNLGMITSAVWSDINSDGRADLVVTGEWMPIHLFINENDKFSLQTIDNSRGLWTCIVSSDIDGDGDQDLIAGNLGLNTPFKVSRQEPIYLYAADFDDNGSVDPIFSVYRKGENGKTRSSYPWHSRDAIMGQLAELRQTFTTYKAFGKATTEEILAKMESHDVLTLKAETTATSIIKNNGDGRFELKALPIEAQISKVNSIVVNDLDKNGIPDLILGGNSYATESNQGWHDASHGICLLGNTDGSYTPLTPNESGLIMDKSITKLAMFLKNERSLLLGAANSDTLLVFQIHSLSVSTLKKDSAGK